MSKFCLPRHEGTKNIYRVQTGSKPDCSPHIVNSCTHACFCYSHRCMFPHEVTKEIFVGRLQLSTLSEDANGWARDSQGFDAGAPSVVQARSDGIPVSVGQLAVQKLSEKPVWRSSGRNHRNRLIFFGASCSLILSQAWQLLHCIILSTSSLHVILSRGTPVVALVCGVQT